MALDPFHAATLFSAEIKKKTKIFSELACSWRSDSQERGRKIHGEKKRGETRGSPPSRFPGVQLNSLATYRSALLSERLEQAISEPVKFKEFGRIESLLGGPFAETDASIYSSRTYFWT